MRAVSGDYRRKMEEEKDKQFKLIQSGEVQIQCCPLVNMSKTGCKNMITVLFDLSSEMITNVTLFSSTSGEKKTSNVLNIFFVLGHLEIRDKI